MSFKPDVATPWPADSEQRQQLNEGTGDNVFSTHHSPAPGTSGVKADASGIQ